MKIKTKDFHPKQSAKKAKRKHKFVTNVEKEYILF